MVPGLAHCFKADGPWMFDVLSVLDQWVETGKAPDRIIASSRRVRLVSVPECVAGPVRAIPPQ